MHRNFKIGLDIPDDICTDVKDLIFENSYNPNFIILLGLSGDISCIVQFEPLLPKLKFIGLADNAQLGFRHVSDRVFLY